MRAARIFEFSEIQVEIFNLHGTRLDYFDFDLHADPFFLIINGFASSLQVELTLISTSSGAVSGILMALE